jgi:hypothetical protein
MLGDALRDLLDPRWKGGWALAILMALSPNLHPRAVRCRPGGNCDGHDASETESGGSMA